MVAGWRHLAFPASFGLATTATGLPAAGALLTPRGQGHISLQLPATANNPVPMETELDNHTTTLQTPKPKGTTYEVIAIFRFFKMAAVRRIRLIVWGQFGPPTKGTWWSLSLCKI